MSSPRCHWVECQQNTPEWVAARLGKITASRFQDIRAKGTHGNRFGKAATDYAAELVIERLTNKQRPDPHFKATKWGNDNENAARATYTMRTGRGVDQVGFATHIDLSNVGCSSDGLISEDGCLEIKCPYSPIVHLNNFRTRSVPGEYRAQCQGNLWIMQRDWIDFESYDPRYPESAQEYQAVIVRVHRSEEFIESMAARVKMFSEYVDELMAEVQQSAAIQEEPERG